MARPNQSLTHRARIVVPELHSIATCSMASATKAPLLRTAQLRLAVMPWRLIVFANLDRQ